MLWLALQGRTVLPRMQFYQVYQIVELFRKACPSRLQWFSALRSFRLKHKLEQVFPELLVTLAEFQGRSDVSLDVEAVRKAREDLLVYVASLTDSSSIKSRLSAAYASMKLN